MTEATDKIDELCKSMNVTRKELAQMKVYLTPWADPEVDENKFWSQCAAIAEIDINWARVYLSRSTPDGKKYIPPKRGHDDKDD